MRSDGRLVAVRPGQGLLAIAWKDDFPEEHGLQLH